MKEMVNPRYLRHSLIDWFSQTDLKQTSLIVIGAGAIGNEIVKNLCLLGIGWIHIIDCDIIEIHNLTRTVLFNESNIGRYKSEVAAEVCRELNPDTKITFSTQKFWNSIKIDDLKNFDAVFCCVDNFEARFRLNKLCIIARKDFFNSAIDSRFITIEQYPYSREIDCACYECNMPPSVYNNVRQRYSCGWLKKRAFEEKKIPTTIITSSIAAAGITSLFLQKKHPNRLVGSLKCFIDSISMTSSVSELHRDESCITCSSILNERYHFLIKRHSSFDFMHVVSSGDDPIIYFSEQVILDVFCKSCGKRHKINDIAEKYDDSLIFCEECRKKSNDIIFVDQMKFSDLLERFGSDMLPIKYLSFNHKQKQFILELED